MVELKPCPFCESLKMRKQIHRRSNKNREGPKYLAEYTVAIVERNWFEDMPKRNAGRTTAYRNRGIGYPLNYCPSCGKKV